tara:strand:- start:466 stop:588 length:123 start_codon:yes stop_codon:yes gene_type:complete
MEFLLWHGLAIATVIVISFTAGYITAGAVRKLTDHYRNLP